MKRFCLLLTAILIFGALSAQAAGSVINKGVWVTVFSAKKVLYSKDAALELINTCKEAGINEIYLQVYQSGRAYYDSAILDKSKFAGIRTSFGSDPVSFIIKEAHKNNIKVFAWVNLLSLGQNTDADIIGKFGRSILTRDQYLRPSGRDNPNDSDKYYLREEQLFLEPGDPRVARFLISVSDEIIKKYPDLNGIHLDYVRYPMTVPFIPGSRFSKLGLVYGYGIKNIESFKAATGIDPLKGLVKDKDSAKWDDWKRLQVTLLVKRISRHIKLKNPGLIISAAVIPSSERAYSSMFQDWPLWLEDNIIDHAVLMNYSLDNQLSKEILKSGVAQRSAQKVYAGIGAFIMKDNPEAFLAQYKLAKDNSADGIVIFSYDDLTPEIIASLKD